MGSSDHDGPPCWHERCNLRTGASAAKRTYLSLHLSSAGALLHSEWLLCGAGQPVQCRSHRQDDDTSVGAVVEAGAALIFASHTATVP